MTLVLSRIDYTTVGVTSRGSTAILPATELKQTQKFSVGDHDGILYIYGMKKGELQLLFKSLPGTKISKVVIGGALGAPRDKIFIAYGNSVKGFTKKGKLFLEFDTSLIEPLSAIYVLGANLAACARDLYHRYKDCKDADSYLSGEIIHDVILTLQETSTVCAILACGDSAVRIVHGTENPTLFRLPSIPVVLSLYREGNVESKDRILVGTMDGRIGLLIIQGNITMRVTWLINATGSEITSLDTYELQDGLDILVGRQDGVIEVYNFPEEDMPPSLRYRYNAGESISSVRGGIISAPGYGEILVTTYSGRIFGLTTKPPGLLELGEQSTTLMKLKAEIQQLEEKLIEEKQTIHIPTPDSLTPLILSVNHRMYLLPDEAAYHLSIELDTSIDNILIQSDTPMELLDVENNSAVVSSSPCNPKEGNFVLATYRCQINTNRLEMKLRTIEGQSGTLNIYVTSQVQPKCCRKISLPICALSLHVRLHDADDNTIHDKLFNELKLNGNFTVAEMHAWLSLTLPDVPERPHLQENEAVSTYSSSFVGTILKCRYKKGSASFLCENISTITILRDALTKEATKRKIKLDVFCDVKAGSVIRVLDLIFPKLEKTYNLMQNIKILNALQEWEVIGNPKENLCFEYQNLLKNETEIRSVTSKNSDILEQLQAVIMDLYVDWERAKGSHRMSNKLAAEKLNSALQSRDLALLKQIFLGNDNIDSTPSNASILNTEI